MASIAVFVALGGGAYAAATIDGKNIRDHSVAGKKLKADTLTGKQINERRLGRVPSATSALRAGTAQTADTATTATTAQSATTAGSAKTAETAASATTAGSATTAKTADHATSADNAQVADSATTAGDATTLGGLTSKQLQVSCPPATELYGGMCWDLESRVADDWIDATSTCGNAGGRLPSLSEFIAYVIQPGTQVTTMHWTSDVVDITGGKETVATSDEGSSGTSPSSPTNLDYRCLFYRVN
jgi:hypothetical protein